MEVIVGLVIFVGCLAIFLGLQLSGPTPKKTKKDYLERVDDLDALQKMERVGTATEIVDAPRQHVERGSDRRKAHREYSVDRRKPVEATKPVRRRKVKKFTPELALKDRWPFPEKKRKSRKKKISQT